MNASITYCNLWSYECKAEIEINFFPEIPDPPRDCVFRNTCERCIEIICEAGADGGLQQSFVLEVNEVAAPPERHLGSTTLSDQGAANLPLLRYQENEPVFRLDTLQPGREYQMLVYAVNAKGRSHPPVQISNIVLNVPADSVSSSGKTNYKNLRVIIKKSNLTDNVAKETYLGTATDHSILLLIGVLGLTSVLVIIGVISAVSIVACKRSASQSQAKVERRRHRRDRSDSSGDNKTEDNIELREASEHGFGEGFQRRSIEWRESRIRASLYLHDPDARTSQHITIGKYIFQMHYFPADVTNTISRSTWNTLILTKAAVRMNEWSGMKTKQRETQGTTVCFIYILVSHWVSWSGNQRTKCQWSWTMTLRTHVFITARGNGPLCPVSSITTHHLLPRIRVFPCASTLP